MGLGTRHKLAAQGPRPRSARHARPGAPCRRRLPLSPLLCRLRPRPHFLLAWPVPDAACGAHRRCGQHCSGAQAGTGCIWTARRGACAGVMPGAAPGARRAAPASSQTPAQRGRLEPSRGGPPRLGRRREVSARVARAAEEQRVAQSAPALAAPSRTRRHGSGARISPAPGSTGLSPLSAAPVRTQHNFFLSCSRQPAAQEKSSPAKFGCAGALRSGCCVRGPVGGSGRDGEHLQPAAARSRSQRQRSP